MSDLDRRLHDALHQDQAPPVSADLFARVVGSIGDDQERRRRNRKTILMWAAGLIAATAAVLLAYSNKNGHIAMPWWTLELITIGALLALALWLGPFIKRFGRAYAADVFHDSPQTGKSYIVLTDIVYYLIFSAYILFMLRFAPAEDWSSTVGPNQLAFSAERIGGILLIIGALHGVNLMLMPILGRLFSLNKRLPRP